MFAQGDPYCINCNSDWVPESQVIQQQKMYQQRMYQQHYRKEVRYSMNRFVRNVYPAPNLDVAFYYQLDPLKEVEAIEYLNTTITRVERALYTNTLYVNNRIVSPMSIDPFMLLDAVCNECRRQGFDMRWRPIVVQNYSYNAQQYYYYRSFAF
jgi:hypothetical protein